MDIREAVETAMQYEQRIRDLYGEAARKANLPQAKRFFQMLSDDEQSHFDYLAGQLKAWDEEGKLEPRPISSDVPRLADVDAASVPVSERLSEEDRDDLKQVLSKALKAEVETSDFYRKLTEEFTDEAKTMFSGFLAIEENHVAAVEAELNVLTGSGFFFDVREFTMEG